MTSIDKKNTVKRDPTLGLCLGGGGGLGFLHVGLFQAMEELGIYPGVIAGTSSGAVMGALYSSGKSIEEIYEIMTNFRWTRVLAPSILRHRGFSATTRMEAFYREHLGETNIEDLPIRLKIAATNFVDGTVVGFSEGPLPKCLAASSAIPGLFEPVRINGGLYYDPGGIYNLPLELFKGEGVKRIIAGNTIGRYSLLHKFYTPHEVLNQAYLIRTMHLVAMRTGPNGWQGREDEELIMIDYRTNGANPSSIGNCAGIIEETRKLSVKVLGEEF